uniref:CRM-domain containing factor CFM9, mitochondrial n=1 Tax=Erigeron canadensis TaxID=72917 RepID=UPI001CB9A622|nr:CRM-domain containing factor CFM9, mitochondrial [Erigeron canadensis]
MFIAASRNLQKHCFQTLTHRFITQDVKLLRGVAPNLIHGYDTQFKFVNKDDSFLRWVGSGDGFDGNRMYSTSKGRSMRSKVEMRMKKESGKTLREIRRAKKIQKKLMTDEERLVYNLKRAKKKVALLLQKLKKYELPELPPPRHDPELLTPEQVQALKKIGFRNRNYVPVGVRGVFGGVVQNMHMHWKFHETVQVCCDNFPKEKIKEMATMLARLSGGIVVNIHNVKTIIMFRGRNYRQPKNLIPINTLTKRKALFKARFEQALDSQKLNIKKIEQQLRRMNVNPDDPVAMASIQRVASTFFNAIDKKEGSPYVFHGDKKGEASTVNTNEPESGEDSDQEELDKFIAEIEEAADREWEAEEAAEKEEVNKIRYLYKEDYDGRYTKPGMGRMAPQRSSNSESDEVDEDDQVDENDSDEASYINDAPKVERWKGGRNRKPSDGGRFNGRDEDRFMRNDAQEEYESEDILNDLQNVMFETDGENEARSSPETTNYDIEHKPKTAKNMDENWDSD